MKILSVEYQNHPIIRNLNLDFLNPVSGLPFDNIVLAGENGIGKSTILKTLNYFAVSESWQDNTKECV